jgi:hypothetical protein
MFDRSKFLKVFDKEFMTNEEVGFYDYTLSKGEFTFGIAVQPCEYFAAIWVEHALLPKPIVYLRFYNLFRIICDEQKDGLVNLVFYKKNETKPLLIVTVKPYLHISYNFE